MSAHRARSRPPAIVLAGLYAVVSLLCLFAAPRRAVAVSGCAQPRTDLTPDTEETALISRINDYRVRAGLGRLTVSRALMASAAWKSYDLSVSNYPTLAHDDAGRSWGQRFHDCGYPYAEIAENLAAGSGDAAGTFEQWRSSPAHNSNLLDGIIRAKVIGVARVRGPGTMFGWYWTAEFGGVDDSEGPSQPGSVTPSVGSSQATLAPGSTATVSGTGQNDCLKVHVAPSLSSDVVDCLADGTSMIVVNGPVSADGYIWLRLGNLGWAVTDFLVPATP
jgi:uncharacterized protein YkwD